MKNTLRYIYCFLMMLLAAGSYGQEITLLQQFNGRFDFTFIGNTMNTGPNNDASVPCEINTVSSANLDLPAGNTIEKAYLYWAGSGNGDFEVKLNGQDITPDDSFNVTQSSSELIFFSAMKDITAQVAATGNGTYTLSELDLTSVIPEYCQNATNFAGWAIIIIYGNSSLPLNQINVYSGLDYVAQGHTTVAFELNSLNVIDANGAKIGVLAWEGDPGLASETLKIKDASLSNGLNPENNVFNSTNSITNSTQAYNMDLDIYDIHNYITPGDSTATVTLSSTADFVMINAVVTKLNNQLPDATILAENIRQACDSRSITVDYTVFNINSTDELQPAVPIAIFANDTYIQYAETILPIPIGASEQAVITLLIPPEIPDDFILRFVVDQNGTGAGIVTETNETNNVFEIAVSLWTTPRFHPIADPESCDIGFGKAKFDLSLIESQLRIDSDDVFSFYKTLDDAQNRVNEISTLSEFISESNPDELFILIENPNCFTITTLNLITKKCPPVVYNLVEPFPDGFYDTLFIEGLRNVFFDFNLNIYNRWGNLVWNGNNATADWNGTATKGNRLLGDELTEGTYFYILELNDPEYPNPLSGFIYLKR